MSLAHLHHRFDNSSVVCCKLERHTAVRSSTCNDRTRSIMPLSTKQRAMCRLSPPPSPTHPLSVGT
jgi:hypothetical protein